MASNAQSGTGTPGSGSNQPAVGGPASPESPDAADEARAAEARHALANAGDVEAWATRFALLGDVNRLKILLALHRAPGMTVGDLATAVGMTDNAVSHALSALRVTGVLSVDRDGRYRRWSVLDETIHDILHEVGASHSHLHPDH